MKIETLQELIRMKTINGGEHEAAQFLSGLFQQYGIETTIIEHGNHRSSLVAEMNGPKEGGKLALSGHFDVVAVDDESEWSHDPFAGEIKDGKLYGRGAADMKAGVAAAVIAMLELKEADVDFNGTIRFLGTAGEEVGMVGSKILAEQGYVKDIDALILAEPSNGEDIHHAHKGLLNYTVCSQGKTGHSSSPESSVNAIEGLNDYMNLANKEIKQLQEAYENEVLGKMVHSFTVIEGGNQPNSIPAAASLTGVFRTIPEIPNSALIEKVEALLEQLNEQFDGQLKLKINQDSQPVIAHPNSALVQATKKVVGDQPVTGVGAVADAAGFAAEGKEFDLVMRGPGKMELAHATDESVEVEAYLNYIDELKEIIQTYLKNEKGGTTWNTQKNS